MKPARNGKCNVDEGFFVFLGGPASGRRDHLHRTDTNVRLSLFTVAALVLALLAWCEMGMAYPAAWRLYLLVALAFAVALTPFAPGRFQRIRIMSLLVLFSTLAALHYVPWTSRKPFLRDLDRIRAGMTEAQVRHIMNRYLEGTGWPASSLDNPTNGGRLGHCFAFQG